MHQPCHRTEFDHHSTYGISLASISPPTVSAERNAKCEMRNAKCELGNPFFLSDGNAKTYYNVILDLYGTVPSEYSKCFKAKKSRYLGTNRV